ncbi:MAG: transporter permease [Acidimicrobiales bacterium]|nr:transporter permease [Acidimicrobiales bacterium]
MVADADASDRAPALRTRGRRPSTLLGIRTELAVRWRIVLGVLGVASVFALWAYAAYRPQAGSSVLVPSPARTWHALSQMWSAGTLRSDLAASAQRVAIGYSISVALGIVLGIAIGSFASVEAFLEPQLGFLRYIPATALTPLFLLWLGIDESPKIWLIAVGTVFYNVLMIADVARNVPREMLNAAYTLGAGRRTILRRVILPHSWPGIIDVARINLAAAWLMLVVAELLAAQKGLAYQINLAQRFRAVDTMFALLIVFGVIGLISDLALRALRNRLAAWARP